MSLEDVKGRKWYVTTKGARHSYARVVHTQECSYVPRATNAHVWTRNPLDEPDTSGLYPCERCKPQPSPETIAKLKAQTAKFVADAEAAEREREQAREEKRERARRLFQAIQINAIHTPLGINGDYLTIDWEGHRYEIREVHRLED